MNNGEQEDVDMDVGRGRTRARTYVHDLHQQSTRGSLTLAPIKMHQTCNEKQDQCCTEMN